MNEPAIDGDATRPEKDVSSGQTRSRSTASSSSIATSDPAAAPSELRTPTLPAPADWGGPVLPGQVEAIAAENERFSVLHSHARGGLGEVFVAVDKQLHREVAVKEIQARFADHPSSRNRFLLEAEITGGLEHPGIVPVYALGAKADGRLFYAMRFIRGRSLQDAIADFHGNVPNESMATARRTTAQTVAPRAASSQDSEEATRSQASSAAQSTRATGQSGPDFGSLQFRDLLHRFVAVCDAVGYAHSRGVLHRDLKPANIMVGDYGETLVVDWGLAKSAGAALSDAVVAPLVPSASGSGSTPATQLGSTVGTPAYMSPEQAVGDIDRLTVSTDIFSLGATLYALLVARPPYRGEKASETLGLAQTASWTPARVVNPRVPKPLDAICGKAMALEPANRYVSCRHLAADIARYLADEPVAAYVEPLWMRGRRWLRKHPGQASAAAAAVLVGVVSLALGAWALNAKNIELRAARDAALASESEARAQSAEAKRQKAIADENSRRARKAVDDSFTEVSEGRDLRMLPGAQPFRRRMLAKARSFYEEFLKDSGDDPQLIEESAAAYFRLGSVTAELSPGPAALANLQKALALRRKLIDPKSAAPAKKRELVTTLASVGSQQLAMGQTAAAKASFEEAIALQRGTVDANPSDAKSAVELASLLSNLSGVLALTGNHVQGVDALRKARAIFERAVKENPLDTEFPQGLATVQYNLGDALLKLGKTSEAQASFMDSLKLRERLAAENPQLVKLQRDLAFTHSGLGSLYLSIGKRADSLARLEQALAIRRRIAEANPSLADFQKEMADSFSNVAVVTWEVGKPDAAIAAHRQALAVLDRLMREHPTVPGYAENASRARINLGFCLFRTDKLAEAFATYRAGAETMEKLVAEHPANDVYLSFLAELVSGMGGVQLRMAKLQDAEKHFIRAISLRKQLTERHPTLPNYRLQLGGAQVNLGHISRDLGKLEDSVDWFLLARKSLEAADRLLPKDETARRFKFLICAGLAMTYDRMGKPEEALAELNAAEKLWPIPAMTDSWRIDRLTALAKSGRARELAEQSAAVLKMSKRSGSERYLIAKAFALAGAAVELDTRQSAESRRSLAADMARRAAEMLAKMQDSKELDAKDWKAIAEDRELEWFRSRPEFKNIAR